MQSTSSQRMTLLFGVSLYRGMQKQLEVQGRMERFWLQVVLIALYILISLSVPRSNNFHLQNFCRNLKIKERALVEGKA